MNLFPLLFPFSTDILSKLIKANIYLHVADVRVGVPCCGEIKCCCVHSVEHSTGCFTVLCVNIMHGSAQSGLNGSVEYYVLIC